MTNLDTLLSSLHIARDLAKKATHANERISDAIYSSPAGESSSKEDTKASHRPRTIEAKLGQMNDTVDEVIQTLSRLIEAQTCTSKVIQVMLGDSAQDATDYAEDGEYYDYPTPAEALRRTKAPGAPRNLSDMDARRI